MTPIYRLRRVTVPAALLLCTVSLVACGSSSKAAPGGSATPGASAAPSATTTRGGNGFRNNALFTDPKVKQCLSAAGISLPSGRPSGAPRPSFTGAPPSGERPSGANGFTNSTEGQKIQQALQACGIALPTGRPTRSPGT